MKAMILSAGLGTRLRPVTNAYAKPAVPFLNMPLLYYPLALLQRAGVDEFVINTHYLADQVASLAKSAKGLKTSPVIKHEEGAPFGSGGGVWNARAELKGSRFWVANGDEVILPHSPEIFDRVTSQHENARALATIVVMEHPGVGTQFGGVWADSNNRVKGFGKSAQEFPGTRGYHYIGIQILEPRVFDYMPEGESNILYDTLKAAIAAGEVVQVAVCKMTWFETGNPHDFLKASEACIELLKNPSLANGSDRDFLIDALKRQADFVQDGNVSLNSKEKEGSLLASPHAKIASSAKIEGFVVAGDRVIVGDGARVANSVLLPGAVIQANANIENQIVLPTDSQI